MKLSVNPNVVFEQLDGQTVLLQLDGGVYYKLNATGSRVWALIQEHGDLEKVHDALASEYRVDPGTVREEVARLIEDLEGQGLVVIERP